MTKNGMIRVFDENGNEIGQTYPKRGNGLIKKGRARFMDESKTAIVLTDAEPNFRNTEACPPNNHLILSEDIKMDTNTSAVIVCENNSEETPVAETTYDGTSTMPEELRRLYDKLDEIDEQIRTLSMCTEETHRLEMLIGHWGNVREDTIHMIEAFKKEHAQVENPMERYVNAQVQNLQTMLTAVLDELTRHYADIGDISEDDFCERYELLCDTFDNRIAKLLKNKE